MFLKGDTIEWATIIGNMKLIVLDVFDYEPKSLLATDLCRTTMKNYYILQCDCKLVERPENQEAKTYTRRVETAKELPDYRIPRD